MEKLYTIAEVAEHLRMSRAGVMNLVSRGQLPAVHVPGETPKRWARVLIAERDLLDILERWKNRGKKPSTLPQD